MAAAFQAKGFPGICLFSRAPIAGLDTPAERAELESNGLIRYESTYVANFVSRFYLSGTMTYPQVVDSFNPKQDKPYSILGIATSMNSHTPHPSNWNCPGNTPAEFQRWLQKAADFLKGTNDRPKVVTCYNFSEWAEGGSGLQPNVQDGFGYMEAVKNVLVDGQ